MDADGKFLTENMFTKLGSGLDDEGQTKLREIIDKCTTEVTETDDLDKRAFLIHNCYWKSN